MAEQIEPNDSLPYRPMNLSELANAASCSNPTLPYLLAMKFNYDVKQGGFAQLLYNMQGDLLGDIEGMLLAARATVAHEYFVRALRICLENKKEYFRFLSSNFVEANDLKDSLHSLSIEYLQRRADFVDEAAALLGNCPKPSP